MENIAPKHPSRKHRNEVHLHGTIDRDLELRYTPSGKAVCNFMICTTCDDYTQLHKCTAWEQVAERLVAKCKKGDYVRVCGRLRTHSYVRNDAKFWITEVVIWNFGTGDPEPNAHGVAIDDSEIPF